MTQVKIEMYQSLLIQWFLNHNQFSLAVIDGLDPDQAWRLVKSEVIHSKPEPKIAIWFESQEEGKNIDGHAITWVDRDYE